MPSLLYKFENQEHRFDLGERTAIGRLKDNDLCIPAQFDVVSPCAHYPRGRDLPIKRSRQQ